MAESRFGGWKGMAVKIGVPVERLIWKRFRNRQDVIAALREHATQGKSLGSYRIFKEDNLLYYATRNYVGKFDVVYRMFGISSSSKNLSHRTIANR
jgi:hypothetical protein